MIGKRQMALLTAARQALGIEDALLALMMRETDDCLRLEHLSRSGFEAIMDRCTCMGFRDPRRPVLSAETHGLVVGIFEQLGLSLFVRKTLVRLYGQAGSVRDLDGSGLLQLLLHLDEKWDIDVQPFITARRSVNRKQVGLLHVAREQVRLDDKRYSNRLQLLGGVNSAADLDQRGFDLMMATMGCWGFVPQRKSGFYQDVNFGTRPGFASAAQLGLIRELWAEWSGSADEAALGAWLERSYRVSALRFLTAGTASGAITALKAMKRRKAEPSQVSA